jgi:hypothetical protein
VIGEVRRDRFLQQGLFIRRCVQERNRPYTNAMASARSRLTLPEALIQGREELRLRYILTSWTYDPGAWRRGRADGRRGSK